MSETPNKLYDLLYNMCEQIGTGSEVIHPVFSVTVEGSSGNFILRGETQVTLTATVMSNNTDITDELKVVTPCPFAWEKYDEDGDLDQEWSDAHNPKKSDWPGTSDPTKIVVGRDDVTNKATFKCKVTI